MPRPGDRRGATLLLTMLMIVLLLVAITASFMRATGEMRVATDQTATVDAFALAQSGVDSYLVAHAALPSPLPDSAIYTFVGGRAVATLQAVRLSAGDSTYVLVSRGENTTTNRYGATTAMATRTVAQLLRRSSGGGLTVPAGFTALSGFDKNGNSGHLSGVDHCSGSGMPNIPGVAVPTTSAVSTSPMYTGHTNPIDGNPDNTPVTIGTPGTTGTAKDAVEIDWAGIYNRTSLTPDYYRNSSGTWSPGSPPTSGSAYKIIFVDGDYAGKFPGTGNGIFIVTGSLTLNGNTDWNGILLVGKTLTSNGNNTVYGATFTGLNIKLGQAVPVQALGNGNKTYQYDSCQINTALMPFAGWSRLGNVWTDNWPSW